MLPVAFDGQLGCARITATGVKFADATQTIVGIDDDIHEAVGAQGIDVDNFQDRIPVDVTVSLQL